MNVAKVAACGMVLVGAVALGAWAQDAAKGAARPAASGAKIVRGQAYPLSKCVVSGEALPADATVHAVKGRSLKLCCKDCIAELDKNADGYVKKFDAAVIEAQQATYPLDTCPLSGKKLATPVNAVAGDRLVRLCCGNCAAKLEKDAAAALQKIDEAVVAAQMPKYALKTCIACDKPLPATGTIEYVMGTRLVRLCCENCIKTFEKDQAGLLKKLNAPAKG